MAELITSASDVFAIESTTTVSRQGQLPEKADGVGGSVAFSRS